MMIFEKIQILPPPQPFTHYGGGAIGGWCYWAVNAVQQHQHIWSPLPGKGGNRGDGFHIILPVNEPSKTVR